MAQNGLFPVSISRHRDRYWRRFTSFEFAREMRECPLVAAEILPAAAAFPIVFREQEDGVLPFALLSVDWGNHTPFVSPNGRWLASYVPSVLRCHPFVAEPIASMTSPSRLFVDEGSGLVTSDCRDQPFFSENGELAPELHEVLRFFKSRQSALVETKKLCAVLAKMELLTPLDQVDMQGLLGIDNARLERLPQAHASVLFNSGALQMIHAHQVSLSHCGWLALAQHQAQVAPQTSTPDEELSGFISALATDAANPIAEWEVAYAV